MELDLKCSPIFDKQHKALLDKNKRFICHVGGSRSTKTYSILQSLIVYAMMTPKKTISIVRKSFPPLRGTAMKDFFDILNELKIYDEAQHYVNESQYRFKNGSIIEFFSVDDAQKLRGRKRDICFCNEANELSFEEFSQLNLRTTDKMIFDWNPSVESYHWLNELMLRPKAIVIHSTYKDNPFLKQAQIDEIEGLKQVDEGYYRVYCLGIPAALKQNIFTHQTIGEYLDQDTTLYGLDIGYNHPTALVQISLSANTMWVKELIYSSNLTTADLSSVMYNLNISSTTPIIVDSARPDVIEELRRKGYKTVPATKNVKEGITAMKSFKIIIDKDSLNLQKEFSNYKWKTLGDLILDEPVKLYDDAIDATRYAFYYYYIKHYKRSNASHLDWLSIDI